MDLECAANMNVNGEERRAQLAFTLDGGGSGRLKDSRVAKV